MTRLRPILLVLLLGCSKPSAPTDAPRPAVAVQTIEAQTARTPNVVEITGTVRAKLSATIATRVAAGIRELLVRPGDAFGTGHPLIRLDDRDLRAAFDQAKLDLTRQTALLAERAVAQADLDAAQMRFRMAEAALSYAVITAPFDGIVLEKLCDVGDLAAPGKPLLRIEQPTDYRLEVNVPESQALGVAVGKAIYCVLDPTGEKCEGLVDEVTPAADPATRTVLAKIALKCRQPIHSGMFGRAQLLLGERFAMFVPKDAVHERGQLTYVFIAEAGKARMRLVKTGKEYLGARELVSGVQNGERVIVAGAVSDGQPVTP